MQLRTGSKWVITSNSLTGTGSSEYTYTYPYQALYVTVPDKESVALSKEMISKVTKGEILESSYSGDANDIHSVTKSNVYKATNSTPKKKATTTTKKVEVKEKNQVEEPETTDEEISTETTQPAEPTTVPPTTTIASADEGEVSEGDEY
jgi:hypothetical protein